ERSLAQVGHAGDEVDLAAGEFRDGFLPSLRRQVFEAGAETLPEEVQEVPVDAGDSGFGAHREGWPRGIGAETDDGTSSEPFPFLRGEKRFAGENAGRMNGESEPQASLRQGAAVRIATEADA